MPIPNQQGDVIDFSEIGLITDVPSFQLPPGGWNNSNNIRCKDGSVQGVYPFIDGFTIHPSYPTGRPIAVTQWTPAGSDFDNIAYVIDDGTGKGRVFVYNTETQVDVEITNATTEDAFTLSDTYPPQIFVFNEILIVNPGTGNPQYISADATTSGNLADLPNWSAFAGTSYARIMRPYKNRLIAMNFFDDRGTVDTSDDVTQPIDFVWSSGISSIGSLDSVQWSASSTNTAGDAFLTATPGKIVDGGQLGDYFIVYKEDAVVRVTETGNDFILEFESIFDDDGIYSSRCFADIGNEQHFVIGNSGIYTHDGQGNKQDIAKGRFQETLFNLVNPTHKDRSFVFRQTRDKEIWFSFSSVSNIQLGCDTAFVWDYQAGVLHRRDIPNITDMYESELNGELKIYAAKPGTPNIQVLDDTSFVADGFFERINESAGTIALLKQITTMYPRAMGSVKIALAGTNTINESPTFTDLTFDINTGQYKLDVRIESRYLHIRVTMDGTTNPKLTTIEFDTVLSGRR